MEDLHTHKLYYLHHLHLNSSCKLSFILSLIRFPYISHFFKNQMESVHLPLILY